MEQVLSVYKRPIDEDNPVVCSDESPKQLIGETRTPIAIKKGRKQRYDSDYVRNGVCNIFIMVEPLKGKCITRVTERRTKKDWAEWIKYIADEIYPTARKITIVQDNLNIHKPACLYEYFEPQEAKRLVDRFEFIYTPKHGSWLNIAEIEFSILHRQALKERMDNIDNVINAVQAWQIERNNNVKKINWQFTTEDARIKLYRLYPSS